jgi:hypothetical protein
LIDLKLPRELGVSVKVFPEENDMWFVQLWGEGIALIVNRYHQIGLVLEERMRESYSLCPGIGSLSCLWTSEHQSSRFSGLGTPGFTLVLPPRPFQVLRT